MTQKQFIEQIARQYPETAEGQIREMLNQVADEFAEETRVLADTLELAPSAALSHSLSDRVALIESVTLDGVALPPFRPFLEGKDAWRVVDGSVLEAGIYYSDGFRELDGQTVTVHYVALPTVFTDQNLTAESDIPKRFQAALVLRVMERLELMRDAPDTNKTRALFAQYSALTRSAIRAANNGRTAGTIRPQLPQI